MTQDRRKPWQGRGRFIRQALKARAARLAPYDGYGDDELATEQFGPPVPLLGDQPDHLRRRYAAAREQVRDVGETIYSPEGFCYRNGRLLRRGSIRDASTSLMFKGAPSPARELESAAILEMETPATYGDWTGGAIATLVGFSEPPATILLPKVLAKKSYVTRDLERLGFDWQSADEPVRIRRTHILRKTIPSYDWTGETVANYRRAFGVTPKPAEPGSLVYLARFGTASESFQRDYPSEAVAEIVKGEGGVVFDTRQASPEAFDELAPHTETLVADQGSAVFGVLQWQSKALVELFVNGWWHSANAFFAEASGVKHHEVIAVDRLSGDQFEQRITGAIHAAKAAAASSRTETV